MRGISMSKKEDDRSFWLELEAASKGLTIAADRTQADRLRQLFEELAGDERSSEPDRINDRAS
jgi:hypothetical protein